MDNSHTPSPVVQANIDELTSRDQVGIVKYGVSLSDANLPVEALVQHLLEEQLDGANYARAILMQLAKQKQEAQHQLQEYALLRQMLVRAMDEIDRLRAPHYPEGEDPQETYSEGTDDARELLKRRLFSFDTQAVLRQAARTNR